MGTVHRPQNVTPLVYYPQEYYYNRPQQVFGPGSGGVAPEFNMLFEDDIDMAFENDIVMDYEG